MRLSDYAEGLAATAIALIAMTIFAKTVWDLWDGFLNWLVAYGFPSVTGILLGLLAFATSIYLGTVQLKKFKRKNS